MRASARLTTPLTTWLSTLAVLAALALTACGGTSARSATPGAPPATVDHAAAPGGGGIPPALARESRPIGRGAAFAPPARGPVLGRCRAQLGPRTGVHVEVFAADRVVLVAAGIGVRGPARYVEGRIAGAGCFGALVTLEPTGVVLMTPGTRATVADLFRSWGRPLGADHVLGFAGHVRVYVGGRRVPGPPGRVPLTPHGEIVLEVGPYVPPHAAYQFPPGS